jgi:hypothetical protein
VGLGGENQDKKCELGGHLAIICENQLKIQGFRPKSGGYTGLRLTASVETGIKSVTDFMAFRCSNRGGVWAGFGQRPNVVLS